MKRRFLALILACVLCFTMSISAFAAASSGYTNGGSHSVRCTATLTVGTSYASAQTTCAQASGITYHTMVWLYYVEGGKNKTMVTDNLLAYASAGCNPFTVVSATSTHEVYGGSTYGNWSYTLSG